MRCISIKLGAFGDSRILSARASLKLSPTLRTRTAAAVAVVGVEGSPLLSPPLSSPRRKRTAMTCSRMLLSLLLMLLVQEAHCDDVNLHHAKFGNGSKIFVDKVLLLLLLLTLLRC